MLTLYNVVSSDEYIMDKDGREDFIPDSLWPTILDVFKQYEIIIMGKGTYVAFQNYGDNLLKPFEDLKIRKIVISRDESFKAKSGYEIAKDPEDVVKDNRKIIVSSGPGFNNYLFQRGFVDKIILHKLPTSLGSGVRPFEKRYANDFILNSKSQKDAFEELVFIRIK